MENGTDVEEVDQRTLEKIRKRIKPTKGVPTLLFVGRHNKQKNIENTIEACKILRDQGTKFRFVTAGDGPDFEHLKRLVKKLGLEHEVEFLGYVENRKELMALYSLADLLVFPSLYDNAPMVLREAAVMCTPGLVVKGSCSAEDFKDGDNAFIAENETPEAIAEKISKALPKLSAVGKKAQKTIPISWDKIMQKVVAEYEALIAEKQGRIRWKKRERELQQNML